MIVTFNSNILIAFIKQAKVIKDGFGILIRTVGDNELEFIKSDTQSQIRMAINCDIDQEGCVILPKELFSLIKPNTSMTLTHRAIDLGNRAIEVDLDTEDTYPVLKDNFDYNVFDLSDKEIKELLEVEHAASKDKSKPILQGIHISDNKFIALDGFRLSTRTGNFETEKAVTIKNIKLLKALKGQIQAVAGEKHIKYFANSLEYTDTLIEGNFLDVNKLMPKDYYCKMSIDKDLLENTLKDMGNVAKDSDNNLVTFNIKNDKCIVRTESKKVKVREELNCKSTGEEIDIGFNNKFMLDAIKDLDNIKINFTTPVNPFVLTDTNKIELILPVRISYLKRVK